MSLPLSSLTHRHDLGAWLNANGLTGRFAEIGAAAGAYARIVLSTWKGSEYNLVDPWALQPREVYKEKTDDISYSDWFALCQELAKEDPRVVLIRDYSANAAAKMPDGCLDGIFIDANHCLEAVSDDIEKWYPKVRSGGLFSGHDHYDSIDYPHYCEVKTAVDRWSEKTGLRVHLTACSSWWVIKP